MIYVWVGISAFDYVYMALLLDIIHYFDAVYVRIANVEYVFLY
jgi:hypothetical protein